MTEPPAYLSERAKSFWRETVATWVMDDAAALTLLELACVALGRADQGRELLEAEGLVVVDRYQQVKPHPACSVRAGVAALAFARLLRELRLLEPVPDSESRIGRVGRS